MSTYQKYLDPKVLNKISRLDLKARLIVEGYIAGMHQSPYKGVSPEFITHREYVAGDDLRYLDWKVFGRSDRLYVKQYKQETNLVCYILLDVSESMAYGASDLPELSSQSGVSKLEYATYIAAALSYLLIQQQDAVGLVLFDKTIRRMIEPHSHQAHLKLILDQLSLVTPGEKTDLKNVADYITERIQPAKAGGRKGLVILISDLFDHPAHNWPGQPSMDSSPQDANYVLGCINKIRSKGQDVIVFHLLDDDEVNFPFNHLTRFKGLESYPELTANPMLVQKDYLAAIREFIDTIRRGCETKRIDYKLITTNQPLDVALSSYLAARIVG